MPFILLGFQGGFFCLIFNIMPIYTRTGDRGKTYLGSGKRVFKNSMRVEAYGTIDELNSLLGVILSEFEKKPYQKDFRKLLDAIQADLFCIGSNLANPKDTSLIKGLNGKIPSIEKEIDIMTEKMPPLTNFIFPGGGKVGSLFHLARTIARRGERIIVGLAQKEKVDESLIKYVNRLSDLFLTMSRFANFKEKKKETIWSREDTK